MAFQWGVNLNHWTKSTGSPSSKPRIVRISQQRWAFMIVINGGTWGPYKWRSWVITLLTTGDAAPLEPQKKPTKKGGFVAKKSVGRIVRLAISTLRDPWLLVTPFEWWFRWPPGPMYKIDHFKSPAIQYPTAGSTHPTASSTHPTASSTHPTASSTHPTTSSTLACLVKLVSPELQKIRRLCRTASWKGFLGGKGFIPKSDENAPGSFRKFRKCHSF